MTLASPSSWSKANLSSQLASSQVLFAQFQPFDFIGGSFDLLLTLSLSQSICAYNHWECGQRVSQVNIRQDERQAPARLLFSNPKTASQLVRIPIVEEERGKLRLPNACLSPTACKKIVRGVFWSTRLEMALTTHFKVTLKIILFFHK